LQRIAGIASEKNKMQSEKPYCRVCAIKNLFLHHRFIKIDHFAPLQVGKKQNL